MGEWLLKQYVKATHHVGLHFQSYDDFIFGPVIKKEILDADPRDGDYITVYLPSWCEPQLKLIFHALPEFRFQIFSRESAMIKYDKNIRFLPVNNKLFNESLVNSSAIISGGGFETPAEAIQLGKKIMTIPIRGQYEQQCNAEALQQMGITCLTQIDENFNEEFYKWIGNGKILRKDYNGTISKSLEHIFSLDLRLDEELIPNEQYEDITLS